MRIIFFIQVLAQSGVIEFEPPIFGPSSDAVLEENMIISIDIPMFNHTLGRIALRMDTESRQQDLKD